jgi:hypothetical protein
VLPAELQAGKSDLEDANYPWRMRYCALQNVTLNLPRIAYQCAGDDTRLFAKIQEVFHPDEIKIRQNLRGRPKYRR